MSDANKAEIVAVSHMWLGNYRAWGALTIYHAIVFAGILTVAVRVPQLECERIEFR
jgi:hypothetical protein